MFLSRYGEKITEKIKRVFDTGCWWGNNKAKGGKRKSEHETRLVSQSIVLSHTFTMSGQVMPMSSSFSLLGQGQAKLAQKSTKQRNQQNETNTTTPEKGPCNHHAASLPVSHCVFFFRSQPASNPCRWPQNADSRDGVARSGGLHGRATV